MIQAVALGVWTAGRVATNLSLAAVVITIVGTFFGFSLWSVVFSMVALVVSVMFCVTFHGLAHVGET